ncbi:fructosamine kinase family protein [Consotaella salsifontis]|uniref:Fructosamine-3-kinase n=1 Tax=Consotaella salsifontis TaxID=1365950 RepID=A0A1T4SN57_9HYPH|nr:fructosamine kinase family protein [Consotaella salsifontis]SKA29603.1 Fructosamine-3-kinase [Consotaella salsifontis]
MNALAEAGAALIGGVLDHATTVHGGDLSDVVLIRLADGREAVVKSGPAPRTEAAMLAAISATGAPAPAVLAVDDRTLVIEQLPTRGSLSYAWENLGVAVATLHGAQGPRYGWRESYACGLVRIDNRWSEDWPAFWAEQRLGPHRGHIDASLSRRIDRLVGRLPELLPATPEPALLHGDLWSGNVLVDHDHVTGLIDPACYYGHGEVDLAMLSLFGQPGRSFFDAYGTLDPGFEQRRPIYQLWPALMHLRLFGVGYASLVDRLLREAGV